MTVETIAFICVDPEPFREYLSGLRVAGVEFQVRRWFLHRRFTVRVPQVRSAVVKEQIDRLLFEECASRAW